MQFRAGIQDLPVELIEIRLENLESDLCEIGVSLNCCRQELCRGISQQREAARGKFRKVLPEIFFQLLKLHNLMPALELKIDERGGLRGSQQDEQNQQCRVAHDTRHQRHVGQFDRQISVFAYHDMHEHYCQYSPK